MDWKKEIKLADLVGRKRATESTQAVAEKPVPFWKKELSFRRKPKVEAPELRPGAAEDGVREQPDLAAPPAPAPAPPSPAESIHPPVPASELPPLPKEKKHSLLKKELSFRPKPRSEKPPKETKPKQSLLQKEISFGGRRKAEQPKEKTPKQSPLKREISFRRKPKEAPPARSRGDKQAPGARRAPKRVVGLKIGASQLAAARVANNGRTELVKVVREPLEPGVVVAGELRDPEALAVALKAFFRKHRLPRRGVRLGIASNRIGVRTLDIVGITDPKQLANAIRFRAEEAVLDYQIVSESETEDGQRICRVLLVVAYRELVDRYVAACRKAGIWVVGIDLEAFALLRSLAPPRAEDAPIFVGLGLLLVVSIALSVMFLGASSSVTDKRHALGDAKARLAVLPPLPKAQTAVEAGLAGEQKARVSAVTSALSRRGAWGPGLARFGHASRGRRAGHGADRLHHQRLHVLAGRRRAAALAPERPSRPPQRPAPDELAVEGRPATRRPVRDPRRRLAAGSGLVRTTKQRLPLAAQIALVVVGVLVLGAATYFGLVRPKKAEAARLGKEIDATQAQIDDYTAKSLAAKVRPKIRSADLFRLAKAMPSQADMSGVLLQLNQIAADTGITFQSIAPQNSVPITGYQAVPIQLTFEGNFYSLVDFLFRLRNLVDVEHGQLNATGRLFAIDTLSFDEAQEGFPQISATLVVDAFVYGTQTPATATPTTTTTSMSSTTTTATTTTTP